MKASSGVINTCTRHPVVAATTFVTLSESSNVPAIIGLGLGSFPTMPKIGQRIFPVKETHQTETSPRVCRHCESAIDEQKCKFPRRIFTAENLKLGFELNQRIPIYVAGISPKLLELAGKVGDCAVLSPAPGNC